MVVKKIPSRGRQRTFSGRNLLQIALPLGGIGAGCVCLNGQGGLQDFSIRNKPATTAGRDTVVPSDAAFALLRIADSNLTRLLEGPMPPERVYDQGLRGNGYLAGGHEGLPRFTDCSFRGEYPLGYVKLSDPAIPLNVRIAGFSPFIPLDDRNSSIPCAVLEYSLENRSHRSVEYEFSYHLSHLAPGPNQTKAKSSRNAVIPGTGVFFYNEEAPGSEGFASAALAVIGHKPIIKAMWFRGEWFDAISAIWQEVSTGDFRPNDGQSGGSLVGRNGGSVMLRGTLKPRERRTYPIVITWYFPNVHYTVGGLEHKNETGTTPGKAVCECQSDNPAWRPYYVSQWGDAKEVATYVRDNYNSLRKRTLSFHDALFSSTLPAPVLDAVSANLAIIKSPTVLRQENGNIWGWEGCYSDAGCCSGSCTHVWNYAQSIPHLFPRLERGLREQELERSMDEKGHVSFRSALPDGPTRHNFHAAADGQLGGVMKTHREWDISGDKEWLAKVYPLVKRSIDYCIETWDPRHRGVIEGPAHHTYDVEFWGPDAMCCGYYLGALAAIAALSREIGHPQDASFYEILAKKGSEYLDNQLFNGEYFEQKVTIAGVRRNLLPATAPSQFNGSGGELQVLQSEGPKYQYGAGCLSDGVIGAWLARMCGLSSSQTRSNIQRNLKAIFKYNFKDSLRDHPNTQRPGYAIGNEPGLVLCTWPKGGRPTFPLLYCDEVWTGVEYQVASHLIEEGMVTEGLAIVKAARSRYDGHIRNPWSEYECGNYYARAMSSYALLISLSGFRYSAARRVLYFGPRLDRPRFKVFFSASTGFGTIALANSRLTITVIEGELAIDTLVLTLNGRERTIKSGIVAKPGRTVVIGTGRS